MTNRERVLCALHFEKPDRVPYNVGFTHQMWERMNAYTGLANYYTELDNSMRMVEPGKPHVEVRPEFFQDEYGVVWNRSGADKDIGVVDHPPLAEAENLAGFVLPPVDEALVRSQIEGMLADAGDNFRVVDVGFSLFERAWTLRGMENLLCDMMTEPEFVHELMEKITKRNLEIIDIALEYNVDGFLIGDDWGQQKGLIMGPRCWRTFIKPYLARMYERIRRAGRCVAQHSCGDIREVMDDLYEIGLNMYQTFQPEIYGLDYAQKLKGRIAIWGGISTQQALPCKTPQEIRAITRELLAAFPQGGLVAAPTHDVPGDVPPENILAMVEELNRQ